MMRVILLLVLISIVSCKDSVQKEATDPSEEIKKEGGVDPNETDGFVQPKAISDPLVTHLYTADPSGHVFEDRLYIYPSHDYQSDVPQDDLGSHFDMKDYHVFSMERPDGEVIDHGVALDLKDIPWASKQLWAPDAAYGNGLYYLYFPAKDKKGVFRIGVATSERPEGPFVAEEHYIKGSFSMDPAVFKDGDEYYMYFGGIWGGQLQRWKDGNYQEDGKEPADDEPALLPKIAKLNPDLKSFSEEPKDVKILDENGDLLLTGDHDRRFFEAAWVHRYNGKYYLSYSTGDTHFIAYAIGDDPYGPFTYKGVVLEPVIGWTNHHSIVEWNGKWYLLYHDSTLSKGVTHLRSMKMSEITYNEDGTIQTISPYLN